ncbi:hypothetical protein CANINC_002355 [Pichia inconspicua]|uniref:Zn(2)-C6 fungal-type domain-containing protein n=1 Tax=Pichia inconspicua TaxID=52247 RepID=A0A4T0X1U0_9ASCO|nr:hypothetical protein CANINC_002355 [[Candida] inconspicua]
MAAQKTQSQGESIKIRRSYSRNGCLQCKSRRQKCDETKPRCLECISNGTECSYKKLLKFHDRRSFTVKGTKLDNVQGITTINNSINRSERKIPKSQVRSQKIYQELVNSSSAKSIVKVDPKEPTIDLFCDKLPEVVENQHDVSTLPFTNTNIDAIFNQNPFMADVIHNNPMTSDINGTSQAPNLPSKLSQIELENSLFNGASNLITDLNSLINSFELTFDPLDIQSQINTYPGLPENEHNQMLNYSQSVNLQPSHYTPTLADIKFQGISPTNYSVDSQSVATDEVQLPTKRNKRTYTDVEIEYNEEDENSNSNKNYEDKDRDEEDDYEDENEPRTRYIQTLTESLETYKKQDKNEEEHKLMNSPIVKEKYFASISTTSIVGTTDVDERKAFPCPSKDTLVPFDFIEMLKKTKPDNIIDSLASFFNWSIDSSHTKYLKIFVTHILLNIIPFSTNYTHNAYIDIFLKRAKDAPHLLFAILAISARFEVYQLEQNLDTPNHEEKLKYHNSFRTYYLSSCLKSLESILHSKQTTLNNIESLLLTIQVLASDFSGNKGSQWRTHLHGAKDLLVKFCRYRPPSLELTIVWLWFYSMEVLASLTSPNGGTIHSFNEMDEFLSVLCPKLPQYLLEFKVSNSNIENGQNKLLEPGKLVDTLIYMGISVPGSISYNGLSRFNMYLGYDETMLEVFNMLVYGIECLRQEHTFAAGKKSKKNPSTSQTDNHPKEVDYMSYRNKILVSDQIAFTSDYFLSICELIKKARTFKYINNSPPYIIPLTSEYHPYKILNAAFKDDTSRVLDKILISAYIHPKQSITNNSLQNYLGIDTSRPITGNDISEAIEKCKSELYFSWIDLAQQLNVDASYLRLLTLPGGIQEFGLSIKSPIVQDIVKRMISGLYSLVRFKDDKFGETKSADFRLLEERYMDASSGWSKFSFDKLMNYQFDNRLVMVQWPLYVCGLCSIEIQHKAIIECCFTGLIGLGAGSGEISLRKLQKIWTLQKLGEFDYDTYNIFGHGFAENEEDDYVPFM